jgi:hypothetical protein|tara:strand:- start:248 stop:496 length:249 start_codon:yes stop_codon:yes gene_type:complete
MIYTVRGIFFDQAGQRTSLALYQGMGNRAAADQSYNDGLADTQAIVDRTDYVLATVTLTSHNLRNRSDKGRLIYTQNLKRAS